MAMQWHKIWMTGISLALAACGGSGGDADGSDNTGPRLGFVSTPKSMLTLEKQRSCDAVSSYFSDSIADLVLKVGIVACPGCDVSLAEAVLGRADATSAVAPASFDAFTGTNNQEDGVDELDQVEADENGNFYLLDGGYLVVANGLPPDNLRRIGSLKLDSDRRAEGLLLDPVNQRLVVALSRGFDFGPATSSIAPPAPWERATELLFVNVADPTTPVIDRRLKIHGYRMAARRIHNRVHLVSHWTPVIPAVISGDPELVNLRQQLTDAVSSDGQRDRLSEDIRARVDALVAAMDIKALLPALMTSVGGGPYVDSGAVDCSDVAIPDIPVLLALTSVTSVDTDGTKVDTLHIANSSWNVYASANNLYLTQSSGGWWFSDRQRQQSAIYKIEIGASAPRYRSTGLVGGWIDSPFQLGEHDGFLRVFTNRSERDPATDARLQDNNLYVLADDDAGSLDIIGSVTEFGANERIFSARFVGQRAYVVTFRQIDPLFTFDLSIPSDPRLVGEVEIPGVSTYIHPLDDSHVLTIGFDGDENRLNGNFQVQIFDVQDLSKPQLIQKYVPQFGESGFAWTAATFDHLAFNYFPEGRTLTVPLQYFASELDKHFSGFIAFSIDPVAGIEELGRLDHSDLARARYCVDPTGRMPAICRDGTYLEAAHPRRSVSGSYNSQAYIYTVSSVGMKVSNAEDFAKPIKELPLPYRDDYWWLALR